MSGKPILGLTFYIMPKKIKLLILTTAVEPSQWFYKRGPVK